MRMRFYGGLAGGAMVLAAACPGWAQTDQLVDPRITGPLVAAQQAELALREAVIKAQRDDAQKREKDMSDWFRGYFAAPDKEAK